MTEERLKARIRRYKWAIFELVVLIFMFIVGVATNNRDLMIVSGFLLLLSNQRRLEGDLEDLEEALKGIVENYNN